MKLKDATRCFGSVGILLPLILIFLIAADAAYACPGTSSRVVYRTRTINSRTMPMMRTTVISYGGPSSYARCGDSMNVTRNVKYVAVRGNDYYSSGPRYVTVRQSSNNYYPVNRVRYVAVRNDDIDYAPSRYVVVQRQPRYVESNRRYIAVNNGDIDDASRYVPVDHYQTNTGTVTRYAAVRSGYRTGNGIVGYVDVNDAARYAAVRRVPVYETGVRVVSVRNADSDYMVRPTRDVAVRNMGNSCACAGTLQSSLDDVEAVSPRHVVVKSDYLAGTQEVIVPNTSYDDTAYVAVPSNSVNRTNVGYSNAAYFDDSDTYVPASYAVMPQTRTISYVPTNDDSDLDDQAVLDTGNATYIADDDIGDACLSTVAVQAPMEMDTRTVSYVPASYFDRDASLVGSGSKYVVNDNASSTISYVPVVDEDSDIDADTVYVASEDVGDSCSCPVAFNTLGSDAAIRTVSYTPAKTVSYTPVDNMNLDSGSYLAPDAMNDRTVSDMPADSVDDVDTADTNACACPASESSIVTEPVEAADTSMSVVNNADTAMPVEMTDTQRIAGDNGYQDGLEAGKAAALSGDTFHPADTDEFQMATRGYEDALGDQGVYSDAYRSSYLQGYSAGWNSGIGAE